MCTLRMKLEPAPVCLGTVHYNGGEMEEARHILSTGELLLIFVLASGSDILLLFYLLF